MLNPWDGGRQEEAVWLTHLFCADAAEARLYKETWTNYKK